MIINYPEYVKKVLNRIENAGHEAFVVGGAVRDALLGRAVNDYDVTTSALPEETEEIFSDLHVILTGLKHGTVTAVVENRPVEITTYRIDGDYKDSRHPEDVCFSRNVEDDLSRRDFTVNAMAHSEKRGLVDLFGGQTDLKASLIRAVGDPERRFCEDALRIMRAFRFASKLGFEIEENTLAAAEKCRERLADISIERKTAELEGIFLGEGAKKALSLMKKAKIFEVIAPEISFDGARLDGVSTLPRDFACRMAFCLVGEKNADAYISSLRLSNAVSARIRKLARMADEPLFVGTDPSLRRLMARAGDELGCLLEIKKALGEDTEAIKERADAIIKRGDCLSVRALDADGKDMALIGISGREIGEMLEFLLEAVLENPSLNKKETLLALARENKTKKM